MLEMTWQYIPLLLFVFSQGCDPVYSVGMHAYLVESIEPRCIEDTLRNLKEIEEVSIHRFEPVKSWSLYEGVTVEQYPDQYQFRSHENRGVIVQFRDKEDRISLFSGTTWVGSKPAQDEMDTTQAFDSRIVLKVAQACRARYSGSAGFRCDPVA